MLEKIAAFLFGLLLFQLALYANNNLEINGVQESMVEKMIREKSSDIGQNVTTLLSKMGVSTKVDEELMEMKYPSASISTNPDNGNALLTFNNPNGKNYRLDIYDVNKGLVASFMNVNSDHMEIDRDMFKVGAYIYKLAGENNVYCGTFMLR